jgi:hypothetical protein
MVSEFFQRGVMLPISACIALIYLDCDIVALVASFIWLEIFDCAVLMDCLSSSINVMLLSSSMSFVAFVEPVRIDGSSKIRSIFSAMGSRYSDLYNGMQLLPHARSLCGASLGLMGRNQSGA